ncbi:MAG: DUF4168 domain-containing protein [Alcaligenaceae bacterium]|nr:DUF4168 domain-containing protein [Alcaligenaceae bacterium]
MRAFWAASIIALGMAGPLAAAQSAGGARTGNGDQQVVEPSEEQLQRYASAVKKVSAVAADYQPRFQQAQDAAAKQAVRVEADQKMVDAVEADGMSVGEYNGISLAVRQDPDLRKQVEHLVNQQE